jgi:hypothetical protein
MSPMADFPRQYRASPNRAIAGDNDWVTLMSGKEGINKV